MLTAAARAQCTHAFPNGTNGLQCQSFGSTPPCVGGDGKFFATPFTGLHHRSGLHGVPSIPSAPAAITLTLTL